MPLQYPSLDSAIGTAEGFGKPGTIPTLANNPGDIIAGSFATSHGAIGAITAAGGQQIAVFPSSDSGMAAADALVANNYNGGSLSDLARGWLGASADQSDVDNYSNTLSKALGVPASTPVTSLAGGGSPSTTGVAAPTIPGKIQSAIDSVKAAAGSATSFALFGPGVSWGRAAGFILGLIVLAGAIFLFKPVQENVVQPVIGAGKKAVKGAAVSAAGL